MISDLLTLSSVDANMDGLPSSPAIPASNPLSTDKRKVPSTELDLHHEPSSEESSKRHMVRRVSSVNEEEEDQGRDLDASHDSITQAVPQDNNDLKAKDPFLYFSCDKRRLEHLLGKDLPSMQDDPKKLKRKKRLSFEMDPFTLMTESFPELNDFDLPLGMNDD